MVMADGARRDTFVLKRGAYDAPGEKVTPAIPAAARAVRPAPIACAWRNGSSTASNPLTARVTVNRFWQSYFGFGIVKTVDDFGSQGELPVHPELLDWLAVRIHGERLERQGAPEDHGDERGLPAVLGADAGAAREGPRQPPARPRPAPAPRARK